MGMARVIADVPSRWLASGWFNPCPVQDFKPMLAQPARRGYKRVMDLQGFGTTGVCRGIDAGSITAWRRMNESAANPTK